MIYYTPSAITESKTLLEKLQWIEKYLKDNPIAQFFISGNEYNGIDMQDYRKDLLKGNGTINKGDVVFFANSYIGIVKYVYDETYVVFNDTIFIKGDKGNRGERGQGYILCNKILELTENEVLNGDRFNINFSDIYFNQSSEEITYETEIGSNILVIAKANNKKYIGFFIVENNYGTYVSGYIIPLRGILDITGEQGEKGKNALVYSNVIIANNAVTTNFKVEEQYFNRTPELNEFFIGVGYYEKDGQYISYIGMFKIIDKVEQEQAYNVKQISRVNTTGKQGNNTLLCSKLGERTNLPNYDETFQGYILGIPFNVTDFVRTYEYYVEQGNSVIGYLKTTEDSKLYMYIGAIRNIDGQNIYIIANGFIDITPKQGERGIQGVQGETGQGFNYMGEWVSDNEYHPYDIVKYNGNQYFCEKTIMSSITTPDLDTENFSLFLKGGDGGGSGTLNLYKLPISGELNVSVENLKYIKNNYGSISFIGDMTFPEYGGNILYPNSCFFVFDESDVETDNIISFNLTSVTEETPGGSQVVVSGLLLFKFKNNSTGQITGETVEYQTKTQEVTQ